MSAPLRLLSRREQRALARLLAEDLVDAPSSPWLPEEVGPDFEGAARDLAEATLNGDEVNLLVIPDGSEDAVAGLLRVVPREYQRACHVGSLSILIARGHRRQGLARAALGAALGHPEVARRFSRLELPVAHRDVAQMALLAASPAWRVVRVERDGVRLDGTFSDVSIWLAEVPAHAG